MEYEINAAKQESTKLSPFEVDIGRIPKRPLTRALDELSEKHDTAKHFLEHQKAFIQVAKDHLLAAGEAQRYSNYRNQKDRNFKPGDWVILQAEGRNIYDCAGLAEKWRPKFMGSVETLQKIGEVSSRVELPPSMPRAHNVIHASRLKPYVQDEAEVGQKIDVIVDTRGNVEQVIERILGRRGVRRNREFLVKFVGDTEKEAVWMTKSDLKNAREIVQAYEKSIKGTVRRGRHLTERASVTK